MPSGLQVAGTSDDAVVAQPAPKEGAVRYRFVHRQPVLIGNFAAGQYINKNLRYSNYDLQLYAMPGSEKRLEAYAELTGRVLEFYTKKYGKPLFGNRLVVVQIDDESLDTYSGPGMIFLSSKMFDTTRPVPEEKIEERLLTSGGARPSVSNRLTMRGFHRVSLSGARLRFARAP